MVLAQPIVMVLFMRGEFSEQTVLNVSYALSAYLLGLISFMFIKILAPAYYARQDIKTPVKIGIISMVANVAFNLMLAPFFGYIGLAIGTTLSASLNAFLLYRGLTKQEVFSLTNNAWWFIARIIISAGIMGGVVHVISPPFAEWLNMDKLEQLMQLVICIALGVISYFISILILGIRMKDIKVNT
jgi:putative peptidoglycan lipid II flippase